MIKIMSLRKNSMRIIHRIQDIDKIEEIYQYVEQIFNNQANTFYTMIEGTKCLSKEDLFDEFALKLKFPDYFGQNWDAFDECLNDLHWLACEKYFLFIKDFDYVLAGQIDEVETFVEILKLTVDEWMSSRIRSISLSPLQIVIQSAEHIKEV